MTARDRNNFEYMCEEINRALEEGKQSVDIANYYDASYYEDLALSHPRMIKKRTGLDEYWVKLNTCGITCLLMCWKDTEELRIRRAITIIKDWRQEKDADLYGTFGWNYYKTGEDVAQAIEDNKEHIEKACDVENLCTYCEGGKYSAAWTLPGDDWENEEDEE